MRGKGGRPLSKRVAGHASYGREAVPLGCSPSSCFPSPKEVPKPAAPTSRRLLSMTGMLGDAHASPALMQ